MEGVRVRHDRVDRAVDWELEIDDWGLAVASLADVALAGWYGRLARRGHGRDARTTQSMAA